MPEIQERVPITLEQLTNQMFDDERDKIDWLNEQENKLRLIYKAKGRGKKWPVLMISVGKGFYDDGYTIFCNIKRGKEDWWGESGIPASLMGDLVKLIQEEIIDK